MIVLSDKTANKLQNIIRRDADQLARGTNIDSQKGSEWSIVVVTSGPVSEVLYRGETRLFDPVTLGYLAVGSSEVWLKGLNDEELTVGGFYSCRHAGTLDNDPLLLTGMGGLSAECDCGSGSETSLSTGYCTTYTVANVEMFRGEGLFWSNSPWGITGDGQGGWTLTNSTNVEEVCFYTVSGWSGQGCQTFNSLTSGCGSVQVCCNGSTSEPSLGCTDQYGCDTCNNDCGLGFPASLRWDIEGGCTVTGSSHQIDVLPGGEYVWYDLAVTIGVDPDYCLSWIRLICHAGVVFLEMADVGRPVGGVAPCLHFNPEPGASNDPVYYEFVVSSAVSGCGCDFTVIISEV